MGQMVEKCEYLCKELLDAALGQTSFIGVTQWLLILRRCGGLQSRIYPIEAMLTTPRAPIEQKGYSAEFVMESIAGFPK